MAGLYDRLIPLANDAVGVHILKAAIQGYAVNVVASPRGATRAQALAAINATLETALSGAEVTDLNAIADEVDSASPAVQKLWYIQVFDYLNLGVGLGEVNETKWRADLGIAAP